MKDIPLSELKELHRGDFVTYKEFLNISQTAASLDSFRPTSDLVQDKEVFLKHTLSKALTSRPDSGEIHGVSAQQIGLPINAVYLKYGTKSLDEGDLLLTDPQMELYANENPKFFLKVVKCPTSPIPYYIGLFARELIVSSSNGIDFKITDKNRGIDPNLELSAALQRTIWADKGYIPGDTSDLLINYTKTCFYLENEKEFAKTFDCVIHRDEIDLITKHIKVVDILGFHKSGASILIENFLNLLCMQSDKEWLKVPPVNMLRRQYGTTDQTKSTLST